jgi:hypothetical protein
MALPKINTPKFSLNLPSNDERLSFRPFLVKEEKALLMAAESADELSMIDAVKDTIKACVTNPNFDISKTPYFDLEYIFLNIRAKSIGEIIDLEYRHNDGINYKGEECDHVTPIKINIEDVKVQKDSEHTNKVKLDDKLSLELRYPNIDDIRPNENADETEILARCIVSVFDDEDVHFPDSLQDSKDFIDSLNSKQFANIMKFIETMPKLRHKFKCAGCGQEDEVTLEGIADFF